MWSGTGSVLDVAAWVAIGALGTSGAACLAWGYYGRAVSQRLPWPRTRDALARVINRINQGEGNGK